MKAAAIVPMLLIAGLLPLQPLRGQNTSSPSSAAEAIFPGTRAESAPAAAPLSREVERQLASLDARLREIEARLGRATRTPTLSHNVERRLTDIERRLDRIEQQLRSLQQIEQRLRRLETKP